MEDMKFCQSCSMPLSDPKQQGSNADGSPNEDYCCYCFKDGGFTSQTTMEEMINLCVPHMVEGNPGMTEEEARSAMAKFFPTLKRWAQA